jgi:hypothetical protein
LSLEQLTLLLQHQGHGVVTMDLPSEDGSVSSGTCADVVCAAYACPMKRYSVSAGTRKL